MSFSPGSQNDYQNDSHRPISVQSINYTSSDDCDTPKKRPPLQILNINNTISQIKDQLSKATRIGTSENVDGNSSFKNQKETPITKSKSSILKKTPNNKNEERQETKRVVLLAEKATGPDSNCLNFFTDEQIDLIQEIQSENDELKGENDELKDKNIDLRGENDQLAAENEDLKVEYESLLTQLNDLDVIKSEFEVLRETFGDHVDSRAVIELYQKKQEKLEEIKRLFPKIKEESEIVIEITRMLEENNGNKKLIDSFVQAGFNGPISPRKIRAQIVSLEEENEGISKKINEISKEKENMSREIKEIQKMKDNTIKEISNEKEEMKQKIKGLSEENKENKQFIDSFIAAGFQEPISPRKIKAHIASLTEQNDKISKEKEEIELENNKLNKVILQEENKISQLSHKMENEKKVFLNSLQRSNQLKESQIDMMIKTRFLVYSFCALLLFIFFSYIVFY